MKKQWVQKISINEKIPSQKMEYTTFYRTKDIWLKTTNYSFQTFFKLFNYCNLWPGYRWYKLFRVEPKWHFFFKFSDEMGLKSCPLVYKWSLQNLINKYWNFSITLKLQSFNQNTFTHGGNLGDVFSFLCYIE